MRFIFLSLVAIGVNISCASAENPADESVTNEAQKVFGQMEASFAKAKTIECNFEVVSRACPGGSAKGSFALSADNKCRLETNGTGRDARRNVAVMVSDGTKQAIIEGRVTQQIQDIQNWYGEAMRTGLSRAGVLLTRFAPLPLEEKEIKVDDLFKVSDFELLQEKTEIGSQAARLIQYKLVTPGLESEVGKTTFRVKLWLNAKSNLPLKRVVVPTDDDLDFTLTETYSDVTLNGKLESRRFELPKK